MVALRRAKKGETPGAMDVFALCRSAAPEPGGGKRLLSGDGSRQLRRSIHEVLTKYLPYNVINWKREGMIWQGQCSEGSEHLPTTWQVLALHHITSPQTASSGLNIVSKSIIRCEADYSCPPTSAASAVMNAALPCRKAPVSPLSRYRLLSPTASVRVSPLCLGSMNFGDAWYESFAASLYTYIVYTYKKGVIEPSRESV